MDQVDVARSIQDANGAPGFPFQELPPELQREIFAYLVPRNASFRFKPTRQEPDRKPNWNLQIRERDSSRYRTIIDRDVWAEPLVLDPSPLRDYVALLHVKAFASEARG